MPAPMMKHSPSWKAFPYKPSPKTPWKPNSPWRLPARATWQALGLLSLCLYLTYELTLGSMYFKPPKGSTSVPAWEAALELDGKEDEDTAARSAGQGTVAAEGCREAYATLLTDEAYLPGTMALVWGLRKYMWRPRAVVVMVPQSWQAARPHVAETLAKLGASVAYVPPLGNPYDTFSAGDTRLFNSRFRSSQGGASVMMKLHAFALTRYSRVLLVDSDQLVLRSYDRIFKNYDPLAAGPATFKDRSAFNTNALLLEPSLEEYVNLLARLGTLQPTYDNADMGYLNAYFSDFWEREKEHSDLKSRHYLPWYLIAWRRVVTYSPGLWHSSKHKALGVDCSGPLEEKPWGSKWKEQVEFRELYDQWWRLFNEALSEISFNRCAAPGGVDRWAVGCQDAATGPFCCCTGLVGNLTRFMA